ncbi:MAG: PEP-CTERM sorting domain-containing protein [Planctomycetota bacterium]
MSRIRVMFPTVALLSTVAVGASANTTLLNATFDDQTQAEFETEWTVPLSPSDNLAVSFIESPDDPISQELFPGLDETAVSHFGRAGDPVVVWNGLTPGNALTPTAEQSIRLSVDIFDDAAGNKRMSLGLRQTSPGAANLIELGFWNDPDGYAHRAILFPGTPENPNPNWQAFELDTSLDRTDDEDDVTNVADIGAGWHNYSVLITPSELTFELDLFRDGQINARDAEGEFIGTGEGVDASVTYQIDSSAAAFDNLRFGGPSGVTSPGGGILLDNILLELIDAVVIGDGIIGDYDDSGQVEQGDLNLVLNNWGTAAPFTPNGDPFETPNVDQEELNRVLNNWGSTTAPSFEGAAVPEPATLALLGGLALAGLRRR